MPVPLSSHGCCRTPQHPPTGQICSTQGFFFPGVFPGWQEQSSNSPWLERGGLWAEQGAQGCREVLGEQRGTHWGLAGSEGPSRIWQCLVGFTKVQWGQKEGGEAQQGAVGCCGEQDLFSTTGAPALLWRWEEGGAWLGFAGTAADPSRSLPASVSLCTRCFQGRGCRIQCKRQRHDLHVKLNSP